MDHHYIPQFYLKQWAAQNGKVTYYSIKNDKVVCGKISPKGTGFEVDLFAKTNVSDDQKHIIETGIYSLIDSKGAIIAKKILESGTTNLTDEEKNDWCIFLYSIPTRHPQVVQDTKIRDAK